MVLSLIAHMLTATWAGLRRFSTFFLLVIERLITIPYYRLYHFNTLQPLTKIATLTHQNSNPRTLVRAIALWRVRKLTELQFISIASAVLAAAVIGAFSWTTIEAAHWLTHGFWHASLVLSILGIMVSASQVAVLNLLGPLPPLRRLSLHRDAVKRYEPLLVSKGGAEVTARGKMVFTWQCPLMFMAYSVCFFLAGLTVLVCTPLMRREGGWDVGCNIAVFYLAVFAVAGPMFMFCSFWVYHYVELDLDAGGEGEDEGDVSGKANLGADVDVSMPGPHASSLGQYAEAFALTDRFQLMDSSSKHRH